MEKIIGYLEKLYSEPVCELNFRNNFELMIAVILSAQCTDKRVNQITPKLFEKYKNAEELAKAKQEDVEEIIKSSGFFRNKAKNIIGASQKLVECYNGQVPKNLSELESIPGVGRKTANVIYSVGFGGNAIAVDTHVLRVSNRLGLADTKNPEVCRKALEKLLPEDKWSKFHYQTVLFGRYKCKARNPECGECELRQCCKHFLTNNE